MSVPEAGYPRYTHCQKIGKPTNSQVFVIYAFSAGFTIVFMCAQAQSPIFLPNFFTMDICLFGTILNLKAFYFEAIPDVWLPV